MSYGYCRCGAEVTSRTRGEPHTQDTCDNGHVSPSRMTLSYNPMKSAKERAERIMEEAHLKAKEVENERAERLMAELAKELSGEPKTLTVETTVGPIQVVIVDGELYRYEPKTELPEAKFVSPEPLPTAYENELLDCLIEECAEVIQRATKMKRFGVKEVQTGQNLSNVDRLSLEIGDLFAVYERAREEGLINEDAVAHQAKIKHVKLDKYLQHSPDGKTAA